ncbi:hypothetical protein SapgrDRAFT_1853 [Saprospira grandis DSM 2844]|uniref:Uncharacterized protein n=1 Tax=Saprospira grandis DSM 2844 TaxID=694433 RepID=J1I593_9BACT|nr:hypothetical protein [Saprospira grandis]EJF53548.1 hypothetical protein SapgrDRAFT_1853 [Saprospira grandis DSM 2844]
MAIPFPKHLLLLSSFFLFGHCQEGPASYRLPGQQWMMPFASVQEVLPPALNEISGLCDNGQQLMALNDEEGRLYPANFNPAFDALPQPWGPPGDYEGLAFWPHLGYFILRSDGRIWQLGLEETKGQELPFSLPPDIEYEGLCFWPKKQQLLVAAKSPAGLYLFSPKNGDYLPLLDLSPFLIHPSAVALSEDEKLLYVLAAKEQELWVFDSHSLAVLGQFILPSYDLVQAEALVVHGRASFWIGSEAQEDRPAQLWRYEELPPLAQ